MMIDTSTDRLVRWKLGLRVFYVLLLYRCRHVKGVVEISPSAVAPVCQAGDQLELTCNTTSGMFHRWEFTVFPENVTYTTTPVTSIGTSGVPTSPLTINTSMITFSRLSGQDSSPLVSKIVINQTVVNPVSSGLNGTVVNCFEGISSTESVATTTIRIIDSETFKLSIHSDPEQFSRDGVTVLLEWTLLNSQTYYQQFLRNISVNTDPPLNNVTFTGNMRVRLVLSYNTLYNVSVTQHSTCEQLIRTTFLQLNYNKCSDPIELTNAIAVGYKDPALEGQNVTFTCAPGQVFNGSNVSICMGNEKWEPDPGEVECIGPGSQEQTITTTITTDNNTTLQPTLTNCMHQDTCSRPDTPQPTVGIVLGIIFGIVLVTITIVVVLIIILNKKRFLKRNNNMRHPKYPLNVELDGTHAYGDNHDSKDEGTLVYADIGQCPAPVKSNTLHLDDSRVEYALLDHIAQQHKVSTSQAAQKSDNCPSVSLDNLLIQLRPQVGPQWYQFGEAAGIEKEVLDKLAEQCPPDECIVELFDYWLRNSMEPITWKTVADVLKAISLTELGLDIERVYITGTLPIVVDMNQVPKSDEEEDEPPPPIPARSANSYIDAPSHTVQADSQGQRTRAAPSLSSEVSVPVLPPKPSRMKSSNVSAAQPNIWTETNNV